MTRQVSADLGWYQKMGFVGASGAVGLACADVLLRGESGSVRKTINGCELPEKG